MPGYPWLAARGKRRILSRGDVMRSPYGLEIIESCVACPHREDRLFCNLPPATVRDLEAITCVASYPKHATLFVEGQPVRGVFVLCKGRAKLSTSSRDGKSLIVRIAEAGEVLGLPATITGTPYELTAELLEPTQANFIPRSDFLGFLRKHGEAALRVAQQLGETYHAAVAEMRTIGLSRTAGAKLARFLLSLPGQAPKQDAAVKLTLTLTQEEIAQMIGTSRETVTRLFSEFKKRRILQVKRSTLILENRSELERLADL